MSAIDPIFGRVRTKQPGKSKRRVMRSFKLDEISVVDNPAQEGAKFAIMKRRTPLHEMQIDYDRVFADADAYRKAGMHKRANELESALTMYVNTMIRKTGVTVMDLFSKASSASAADEGIEEMLAELQRQLPDEDPKELRAMLAETLGKEGDEEYLEEDEDDEDEDEDDIDADDLEDEIIQTKAGQDMNDERQMFDEDTGEIAATANKFMRDTTVSKRRALSMSVARAITKRGGSPSEFLAKAESRITTDSHEPFQQQRAAQRRAEMDRRTVSTRNRANAELAAMREGAGMGREREARRRQIDGMVMKLREVDRHMTHTAALRKIRGQYPSLFR